MGKIRKVNTHTHKLNRDVKNQNKFFCENINAMRQNMDGMSLSRKELLFSVSLKRSALIN